MLIYIISRSVLPLLSFIQVGSATTASSGGKTNTSYRMPSALLGRFRNCSWWDCTSLSGIFRKKINSLHSIFYALMLADIWKFLVWITLRTLSIVRVRCTGTFDRLSNPQVFENFDKNSQNQARFGLCRVDYPFVDHLYDKTLNYEICNLWVAKYAPGAECPN